MSLSANFNFILSMVKVEDKNVPLGLLSLVPGAMDPWYSHSNDKLNKGFAKRYQADGKEFFFLFEPDIAVTKSRTEISEEFLDSCDWIFKGLYMGVLEAQNTRAYFAPASTGKDLSFFHNYIYGENNSVLDEQQIALDLGLRLVPVSSPLNYLSQSL